jgi:hypothetical protein
VQYETTPLLRLAQTLRNWGAAPLQPPYALQLYNPTYQYAAAPLNWVPAWMGRGAIYGNVTAVRACFGTVL